MKRILTLVLALCMVLSLAACSPPPDATEPTDQTVSAADAATLIATGELLYPAKNSLFRYDVYTTYVAITEYVGTATEVTIPDTLETLPVLVIAQGAFYEADNITSVIISDNVVEIRANAFEKCDNLQTVQLPKQLTTMGEAVFDGCISLKELTIPASLGYIPGSMCYDCQSLVTVVWEDVPYDANTFTEKSIADYAFAGCYNLSLLWIPDEVTSIGAMLSGETPYLTIHGYTSSAAAHYASEYFIDFEVLDKENLASAIKDAQDEAAKREEESTAPETTEPTVSTQPTEGTTPNE